MIGSLSEVVGIRDDMFLGEGHRYMTEVAAASDESHRARAAFAEFAAVLRARELQVLTQDLEQRLRRVDERVGRLAVDDEGAIAGRDPLRRQNY